MLGCIYTLLASAFVLGFRPREKRRARADIAVSILKPLHGDEPGLSPRLASFCQQDYDAPVQIVTAGLGFFLFGALNPISVAFAILFAGLGADFAIQFNLRYRVQRHASHELRQALLEAAGRVGVPR
jgi:hypothetical protein